MRKFSKLTFTMFLAIFMCLGLLSAQNDSDNQPVTNYDKMMLTASVGYSLPMGTFGDSHNSSLGYGLNFIYKLNPDLGLSLSLGYISWGTELANFYKSQTTIPILIGARYYFPSATESRIYAGLDVGEYMFSIKYPNDIKSSNNEFGFSLLGGMVMPLAEMLYFNAYANYTYVTVSPTSVSYLGINAGVSIKF